MTVLMVLAIFAAFVVLDIGVQMARRRRVLRTDAQPLVGSEDPGDAADLQGVHGRHMWARAVDAVTVAVGLDDVAARLVGRASGIVLPVPGARLRRGARGFRIRSEGRTADLVSPVDGTVVEVNRALDVKPGLCVSEPYDRGWLCKVRVRDARLALAALHRGDAARRWQLRERARLNDRLAECMGGRLAADGGEPVSDLGAHLDRDVWEILVHDFLAADSQRRDEEDGR